MDGTNNAHALIVQLQKKFEVKSLISSIIYGKEMNNKKIAISYDDLKKSDRDKRLIYLQNSNTFKRILWNCLDNDSRKETDFAKQNVDLTILEHLLNEIQINIDLCLYTESVNNKYTSFLLADVTWEEDLSFF